MDPRTLSVLFLVVLLSFVSSQDSSSEEFDSVEDPPQETNRTTRSIGNIARLLLGGSYVTLQLGNVPPDHPLVKYPDPIYSASSTSNKVIAAVPGMTGTRQEPTAQVAQPVASGSVTAPVTNFGQNLQGGAYPALQNNFLSQPYPQQSQWTQPQTNNYQQFPSYQAPAQGPNVETTAPGFNPQGHPFNPQTNSYGPLANSYQTPGNSYSSPPPNSGFGGAPPGNFPPSGPPPSGGSYQTNGNSYNSPGSQFPSHQAPNGYQAPTQQQSNYAHGQTNQAPPNSYQTPSPQGYPGPGSPHSGGQGNTYSGPANSYHGSGNQNINPAHSYPSAPSPPNHIQDNSYNSHPPHYNSGPSNGFTPSPSYPPTSNYHPPTSNSINPSSGYDKANTPYHHSPPSNNYNHPPSGHNSPPSGYDRPTSPSSPSSYHSPSSSYNSHPSSNYPSQSSSHHSPQGSQPPPKNYKSSSYNSPPSKYSSHSSSHHSSGYNGPSSSYNNPTYSPQHNTHPSTNEPYRSRNPPSNGKSNEYRSPRPSYESSSSNYGSHSSSYTSKPVLVAHPKRRPSSEQSSREKGGSYSDGRTRTKSSGSSSYSTSQKGDSHPSYDKNYNSSPKPYYGSSSSKPYYGPSSPKPYYGSSTKYSSAESYRSSKEGYDSRGQPSKSSYNSRPSYKTEYNSRPPPKSEYNTRPSSYRSSSSTSSRPTKPDYVNVPKKTYGSSKEDYRRSSSHTHSSSIPIGQGQALKVTYKVPTTSYDSHSHPKGEYQSKYETSYNYQAPRDTYGSREDGSYRPPTPVYSSAPIIKNPPPPLSSYRSPAERMSDSYDRQTQSAKYSDPPKKTYLVEGGKRIGKAMPTPAKPVVLQPAISPIRSASVPQAFRPSRATNEYLEGFIPLKIEGSSPVVQYAAAPIDTEGLPKVNPNIVPSIAVFQTSYIKK